MLTSAKLPPSFGYAEMERFWRAADDLGFYAIWNYDHFYGLGTDPAELQRGNLEGWTTLAAMAAVVKRARVGCMVTGVTYRNPAVLANMAVSVDHISGGRLEFGIGAAWHEPEHRAYGFDYPPAGTRIAMLDEALDVIEKLWTEETANHEGTYFRLTDALCNPKPVQQPHPPIVVGGNGPKKTLRVVAKHADEWNAIATTPEDWRRLNGILDEHCEAVGRNPKEIRRSIQMMLHPAVEGQVDEQLAKLPAFEEAGAEHVIMSFYQPPDTALLEKIAPR